MKKETPKEHKKETVVLSEEEFNSLKTALDEKEAELIREALDKKDLEQYYQDPEWVVDLSNEDSTSITQKITEDLDQRPEEESFDQFLDTLFLPKIKVKMKIFNEDGFSIPWKATEDAACFDVRAYKIEFQYQSLDKSAWVGTISKNSKKIPQLKEQFDSTLRTAIVHLGFATEIPRGYKAVIIPRSSFTKTDWVMQNSPAQIDSDYRGEWIIKFKELVPNAEFPINERDRVAQIYFERIIPVQFIITDNLKETERNDGGFGSTGNR
jgi:dUTP pyrophosphatase